MNNSDNDSADQAGLPPGGEMLSIEQTLGGIVLQMIREGRSISRQSLCVAVAAHINKNTSPLLEAHYADILRVMLNREIN